MLAIFGALMFWVVCMGDRYDNLVSATESSSSTASESAAFAQSLVSSIQHPLAMLLLQIIAILIAVRIFSYLFKFIGQPGVIGEIMAGIILGPSVLGYFFPEIFGFLFAPGSLGSLEVVSQIGLILFMFVIGLELDLSIIKTKASETLVISHASIIVPFFMGMVFAYFIYSEFAAGLCDFLPFALFLGISVSITAFPVLARIVQERGLSHTPMGMLAIASAANNDVTAWCLLAAVIAIAKAGNMMGAVYTLALAVIYIIVMFAVVKPFMKRLGSLYNTQEGINKVMMAVIFLVLIISSFITEVIGIHALFGAFVAGVIMPANINFRRVVSQKIEDIALVLLLPLFFVFTGLRTEIGLINSPHLWTICAALILVSISGKLLGATFSSRLVGESWKDSLSIGILMNTRGLMELIVLNIGYEMGIISAPIYVMFVIMALFTTFMATPSLALIEKIFSPRRKKTKIHSSTEVRILISFANPAGAPALLNLANQMYGSPDYVTKFTAVHYTIGTEANPMDVLSYSEDSFIPVIQEAEKLGVEIKTLYRVTDHYGEDLAQFVHQENFDYVLTGVGPNFVDSHIARSLRRKPFDIRAMMENLNVLRNFRMLPTSLTRDKSEMLLSGIDSNLGMFINREFGEINVAGIVLSENRDETLMNFVDTVSPEIRIDIMALTQHLANELRVDISNMRNIPPPTLRRIYGPHEDILGFAQNKELLIISYNSWLKIVRDEPLAIAKLPSFLVVRSKDYILSKRSNPLERLRKN